MNKKALVCLVLFIASLFISVFLCFNKINVPYFGSIYSEVKTDIFFEKEPPVIFYDDIQVTNYIKIDKNHYLFVPYRYDSVKEIRIKNIENVKKIQIYNGKTAQFFDEIKDTIKINNDKSLYDKICIIFLSFFYNPQFYFVSYVFLMLFLFNFKVKSLNYKNAFIFLLLLSCLLRLVQIKSFPYWDDEIYILSHSAPYAPLIALFQDPGNPPLYFILFKIYRSIIQNPEFFRISSVIIGVLFNLCFYNYLKFIFNKKTALIGLGIASVNIILIYFSQELRCYMLLMLLAILSSYLLFKFKNKTKFNYLIAIVALLYTHFYGAFYVFYNFICGLILFRKNISKLKSFIFVNIIAFLVYIPLIISKKASLTTTFNNWIGPPKFGAYILLLEALFGSIILLLILGIILYFLYKKASKKHRLFITYNVLAIIFTIVCAAMFSYLIKSIFVFRYFYMVFPCCLALFSYIIAYFGKNNILKTIIFISIFFFSFKPYEQCNFSNHNIYLGFVKHDIDKTKTNYVFMTDTVEDYQEFKIDGANILYLQVNRGVEYLDIKEFDIKKPAILYISNMYLSDEILKNAKNIELYKTPLSVFCKVEL